MGGGHKFTWSVSLTTTSASPHSESSSHLRCLTLHGLCFVWPRRRDLSLTFVRVVRFVLLGCWWLLVLNCGCCRMVLRLRILRLLVIRPSLILMLWVRVLPSSIVVRVLLSRERSLRFLSSRKRSPISPGSLSPLYSLASWHSNLQCSFHYHCRFAVYLGPACREIEAELGATRRIRVVDVL